MKKVLLSLLLLFPLLTSACNLANTLVFEKTIQAEPEKTKVEIQISETPYAIRTNNSILIQPSDLEYLGAFRLPDDGSISTWEYSGRGLTYFPKGDPNGLVDGFAGSLFGTGNDQKNFVSEISIPKPVISRNMEDLNLAATLQPFADITEGVFGESDLPRLGIQVLAAQKGQPSDQIFFVHGQHFQNFEPSHGIIDLTLDDPHMQGPWFLNGFSNYVTSDYLFEIPETWAIKLPGTPRLVTGRFREGVWGGFGPTLFAFDPFNELEIPAKGGRINFVTPLLLYGEQQPGMAEIVSDENKAMVNYNADDSWWGGAWLTLNQKSSVIFVGTKALGKSWYGFANGVVWEYDCAEKTPPNCPEVPEWPYENRGYWAEDYQPQILFYDPEELVKVANSELETWEPQPYASLDLSEWFFNPVVDPGNYKFEIAGAVAYDREHELLFIIERLADGAKSVIHVWKIN